MNSPYCRRVDNSYCLRVDRVVNKDSALYDSGVRYVLLVSDEPEGESFHSKAANTLADLVEFIGADRTVEAAEAFARGERGAVFELSGDQLGHADEPDLRFVAVAPASFYGATGGTRANGTSWGRSGA